MTKPGKKPHPSEAELEILQVLWRRGPCTVREMWEELESRGVRYTTVLKQFQVMTQKGLVARDDTQRAHSYRAAIAQADAQRHALANFIERVFVGSAEQLVLRALETKKVSHDELDTIQKYLESYRKGV